MGDRLPQRVTVTACRHIADVEICQKLSFEIRPKSTTAEGTAKPPNEWNEVADDIISTYCSARPNNAAMCRKHELTMTIKRSEDLLRRIEQGTKTEPLKIPIPPRREIQVGDRIPPSRQFKPGCSLLSGQSCTQWVEQDSNNPMRVFKNFDPLSSSRLGTQIMLDQLQRNWWMTFHVLPWF